MSNSSPSESSPNSHGKREVILDIAASCFAAQGFHAVSMRDIAKANNSSVATLYNHFAGKDELLLGLGHRFFGDFKAELQAIADSGEPGLTRILRMVRATFEHGTRRRNEYVALSQDRRYLLATESLKPIVTYRQECGELWRRALFEGVDDGSINAGIDPDLVTWIVFAAVTGLLGELASSNAGTTTSDPLTSLCDLFSEGLRPR